VQVVADRALPALAEVGDNDVDAIDPVPMQKNAVDVTAAPIVHTDHGALGTNHAFQRVGHEGG
jgi:hypothetical protein